MGGGGDGEARGSDDGAGGPCALPARRADFPAQGPFALLHARRQPRLRHRHRQAHGCGRPERGNTPAAAGIPAEPANRCTIQTA